jgi:hypothetical protein
MATAEDLKRFVRLLFSPLSGGPLANHSSTQSTEHLMAVTPLRSPAFWELQELRGVYSLPFRDFIPYSGLAAVILDYLSEKTSYLDVTDVVKTLQHLPPLPNFSLDIYQVQAVYTVLRYTPIEYLPKNVRIDLTKKAIIFDGQLISTLKPGSIHDDIVGVLSLSREYISRSLAYSAAFDRLVQCHLLPSESS